MSVSKRFFVVINIYIVFITDRFFEVATKSWPDWDLNPEPLNSIQHSNQLSYQAMS